METLIAFAIVWPLFGLWFYKENNAKGIFFFVVGLGCAIAALILAFGWVAAIPIMAVAYLAITLVLAAYIYHDSGAKDLRLAVMSTVLGLCWPIVLPVVGPVKAVQWLSGKLFK